ncbi:MAG: VWA domain-containing protein [Proteobacteria bacterium]|nr:VWA domain-containing protein [Pseudomonadota bacterium]
MKQREISSKILQIVAVLSCLVLSAFACSSGDSQAESDGNGDKYDDDTGNGNDDDDEDVDDSIDTGAEDCGEPRTVNCYCRDGSQRGLQDCKGDGSLTKCDCDKEEDTGEEDLTVCEELRELEGCAATTYKSTEIPASILVVVDRSGSMSCNPPPVQTTAQCNKEAVPVAPNKPSKWDLTIDALKQAFEGLADRNASIGLTFFSNDNSCGVKSDPVVNIKRLDDIQLQTLKDTLDSTEPKGGTPIVGAAILAYQHIHQEAADGHDCPINEECPCDDPPCGASGNRFVILITDGEESCAIDDEEKEAWLTRLLDTESVNAVKANVRTFVVGAPGSEPARGFLSELAFKGGTAKSGSSCIHDRTKANGNCHFDMTKTQDFAEDLKQVLEEISGSAVGCEFTVPSKIENADEVNVQYSPSEGGDPQCIAKDDTAPCEDGANGWQFAKTADGEDDMSKVILCGDECERINDDEQAKVDILLGCESVIVM